jgi:hypothetical protein
LLGFAGGRKSSGLWRQEVQKKKTVSRYSHMAKVEWNILKNNDKKGKDMSLIIGGRGGGGYGGSQTDVLNKMHD